MATGDPIGLYPYIVVSNAAAAINFYKQAFGAKEITRHAEPNGTRLMHVRVELFGSTLMFADDFPEFMGGKSRTPEALGGTPITLHLQVEDAQSVWDQAIAAGAKATMPLADMFWGDRYGKVLDPFGHEWAIGQTLKQMSRDEVEEGAKTQFPAAE